MKVKEDCNKGYHQSICQYWKEQWKWDLQVLRMWLGMFQFSILIGTCGSFGVIVFKIEQVELNFLKELNIMEMSSIPYVSLNSWNFKRFEWRERDLLAIFFRPVISSLWTLQKVASCNLHICVFTFLLISFHQSRGKMEIYHTIFIFCSWIFFVFHIQTFITITYVLSSK